MWRVRGFADLSSHKLLPQNEFAFVVVERLEMGGFQGKSASQIVRQPQAGQRLVRR